MRRVMLPCQAREMSRLQEQVRKLEERNAELKVMLGDALDREAELKARAR